MKNIINYRIFGVSILFFLLNTYFAIVDAQQNNQLTVVTSSPANGADKVGLGVAPTINFSAPLDPATVNSSHIKLTATVSGAEFPTNVEYVENETFVKIVPTSDLKPGISYTFSVTAGVKDAAGNSLESLFTAEFETQFVQWHAGAYILGNVDQNLLDNESFFTSQSSQYAEGFAIRTSWILYEPSEGIYNWTPLDNNLELLKSKDKKVSIAVYPFQPLRTSPTDFDFIPHPAWVQPDQTYFATFKTAPCRAFPVPWDTVVNEKWFNFLKALGNHLYEERPDLLDTISYVNGAGDAVTLNWGIHEEILKIFY